MKKTITLVCFLILALSANAFSQKQKTARQIFMSLPNDYINGSLQHRATFLSFPKSIKADTLSFFLFDNGVSKKIGGDFQEPQAIGSMRVFRGKSRTVVGLRYQVDDRKEKNPTVDTTKIVTVLLENINGEWTEATDSLIPKASVDLAYESLIKNYQMKDVKREDVWIETQLGIDKSGIAQVIRIKRDTSVTDFKWFKWNGGSFVESEY